MPRSGNCARKRLQDAAIELFAEAGFEAATAAQIAARAGVTERTFFRHFSDKRDVLFEGQALLGEALTRAISAGPANLGPVETVRYAFHSVADALEQNRRISEPRRAIILANASLRERESAKQTAIANVVAEALRRRGVEAGRATLAARASLAVFSHAFDAWYADPSVHLKTCFDRAFAELAGLACPTKDMK